MLATASRERKTTQTDRKCLCMLEWKQERSAVSGECVRSLDGGPVSVAEVREISWPMLLGYLAARLLVIGAPVASWLHDTTGLEVTEPQVAAALGVILGWAIWEAGRWLERRTGIGRPAQLARLTGRLLLSLGMPTGQPVYALQGQRVAVLGSDGSMRPPR